MSSNFTTEWPPVTIVIPVRNEVDAIGDALGSIDRQDYPGDIEVVVADGMSDDGTRQALDRVDGVIVVDNVDRTTPAGLNRAIQRASGEVIVRCDAHSTFSANYVRRAVEVLKATGADNVGGVQRAVGDGLIQQAIASAMSSPIGVGDARFHYGGAPGPVDTVYLGVFPRSVFERVGWFDETLTRNQDYELNIRIRNAGGTVYFDPDLVVDYRPRASLAALWRQYFDYGTWKRQVVSKHPASLRLRQLAPPLLIVGLVLSAGMALAGWYVAAAVIPAAWVAVLVAGTVWSTISQRKKSSLLFGLAAGTMHLAWGLGFTIGRPAQPSSKPL